MYLKIIASVKLLAAFFSILPAHQLQGQPVFNKDSLTILLDKLIPGVNANSPGYTLAVVSKGETIFSISKGCADLETGTAINQQTVFNTGSVSKQFTAYLILALEWESKLSCNDLVSAYLDYEILKKYPIRIHHLLHHSSGIREILELLEVADGQNKYGYTTENVKEIIRLQEELNFLPGAKHQYINTNYVLLAEIIEKISGKSFPDYCREKIFEPLGMQQAFIMDNFKKPVPNKAKAYVKRGTLFETDFPLDQFYGGSGLYLTINDLVKWVSYLMLKKSVKDELVEKFTSKGKLHDQPFHYGYGLFVDNYKGVTLIEHNGGRVGYRSQVYYFPSHQLAIVALANYRSFPFNNILKIADYLLQLSSSTSAPPPFARPALLTDKTILRQEQLFWSPEADLVRKIYLKGDQLFYFRSPGNESMILPASQDLYYMKLGDSVSNNRIYFPPVNKKQKNKMVFITAGGDSTIYFQVEKPDTTHLVEYEGRFFCNEVEAAIKMIKDGEKLYVHLKGWPRISLQPGFKDYFFSPEIGSFYFQRDRNQKIISVKYDSPRTRHLIYRKI